MILGRYLLTVLGLYISFSDRVIVVSKGQYEGCSALMFDVSNYGYTHLMDKTIELEESFLSFYVD